MKAFFCVLAVGGGLLILTGHQIPLTLVDYAAVPGGPSVVGAGLILLGLFLAAQSD
jgi:hypothetical protein